MIKKKIQQIKTWLLSNLRYQVNYKRTMQLYIQHTASAPYSKTRLTVFNALIYTFMQWQLANQIIKAPLKNRGKSKIFFHYTDLNAAIKTINNGIEIPSLYVRNMIIELNNLGIIKSYMVQGKSVGGFRAEINVLVSSLGWVNLAKIERKKQIHQKKMVDEAMKAFAEEIKQFEAEKKEKNQISN